MSLRPRQPSFPSPANQRRKAPKKSITWRPNRKRVPCYLKPGVAVEINPEDSDFRGAWFLGKVISIQSSDKIQVEYTTLLDEEQGMTFLKEDIDMSRLRPPPPPMSDKEKNKVIVVGDKVDAFYTDGWWEGVVTDLLADGKFNVYFRTSQELISFTKHDLRFHREWLDDTWEPPLEEDETEDSKADYFEDEEDVLPRVDLGATRHIAKQMFSSGTLVEVSSDDEGFKGCWFTAKIIKRIGEDKYLVEYRDLREEDGIEPLKEETDFIHIRPAPPRGEDVDFAVGDKVDAFYNDGWWEGVVNDGIKDGTLGVFFRPTGEKMRFGRQGLRLHKDWVNGTWLPPLKGEEIKKTIAYNVSCDRNVRPKRAIEKQEFSIGARVEVSSEEEGFEDSWFLARLIEYTENDKCLVEYDNIKAEDGKEPLREEVDVSQIRPQPLERVMVSPFEKHDKVDALYNDGWWVGVIVKVLAQAHYLVKFEKTQETLRFHHSRLRLHQEWIGGSWITSSKSQTV